LVDGTLHIRRIGASAGAEITGVDLSGNLTNDQTAVVHQALLDHLVLCFPDQELSPEDQIEFARRWGDLAIHPNLAGMDDFPEIIAVERKPGDSGHLGSEWHNDTTSLEKPPMGTMMYSKIVPPVGGDTLFANQYDAYDALSNSMKDMLGGLRAVHGDGRVAGPRAALNERRTNKTDETDAWRETINTHPVVRTHPETGRKALYVNIAYTLRFENMTTEESQPLLNFLYEHSHRPEFTYRHRWSEKMLVLWDNRALVHLALNDCPTSHRLMERIQIRGDRPF
jgi:alpha-ketoglutarate-dependent taurine dioxygenase